MLHVGYSDHHSDVWDAQCGVQRPLSTLNFVVEIPCPLLYASSLGIENVYQKQDNEQIHQILFEFFRLMCEN